jgi:hypothetical protein
MIFCAEKGLPLAERTADRLFAIFGRSGFQLAAGRAKSEPAFCVVRVK